MNPSPKSATPPVLSPALPEGGAPTQWLLGPEDYPNIDELVIEDDQPVDDIFTEKQQRLLTEPLYSSWWGSPEGTPFLALANVGLFTVAKETSEVPDFMPSAGVQVADDLTRQENRSYLFWVIGKMPDLVLEIVSDTRGGEDSTKMQHYARIGIVYYVLFDPEEYLGHGVLRAFTLREGRYEAIDPGCFSLLGLGLTLWEGTFEGYRSRWLRWCNRDGTVIPTSKERAEQAEERERQERQLKVRLLEQLRTLGIKPAE